MDIRQYINRMTLEEKCSLLSGGSQFTTKAVPRLGIPVIFLSDGPCGVRKQAGAADHLGLNPSLPATCWPVPAALANSWDPELVEAVGRLTGEEAKALGVSVLLGPGLNLKRSPQGGRNFEYYSEDPYLSGKLAAAYIRGVQSNGISACPKHFAVNSQETLRMHSDSVVDERTLRELYLTGFEIAVKEGQPRCLMSSYNKVNGTYASENRHLLREILVDEWGFDGFLVTDWGGSNDRVASVAAGHHLEMPTTGGDSDREVAAAVRAGRLDEGAVDLLVEEYLRNLFQILIPEGSPTEFDQQAHHAFARKAAGESIVLLKNEGGLLPLAQGTRVAVIGGFAQTPRYQGAGSSVVNPTQVDAPLDCLRSSGLEVVGYEPGFLRYGGQDREKLDAAVALAAQADVALLYLGLDELAESEGLDRPDIKLRDNQIQLLQAVSAANPRVVVVFFSGTPVECPWLDQCQAMIYGCLGGQAGAAAMADALTGRLNPSGKLAESWPVSVEDTPTFGSFPGSQRTAEYRESLYVGYRYYATAQVPVRFPFGFGLSYTSFAYSDLSITPEAVSFILTNTGGRAGAEVAQLYLSLPGAKVFRPALELKGFAKVALEPGESRRVSIPLDDKALRYFNVATNRWEVEGGSYRIQVGASSQDLRLSGTLDVEGSGAPVPYDPARLPSYFSGRVARVGDGEFTALLGHPIPPARWDTSAPLELNDTFCQLSYARGWAGRLVYRILSGQLERARAQNKSDLNALFRLYMPFRSAAKLTGGILDMAMVRALVEIFNGHFFQGVGHLASAWVRKGRAERAVRRALERGPGI